jgi:quercetin dioxygenase-like cupin family protein
MSETKGHEYLRSHEISGDALRFNLEEESAAILKAAKAEATGHIAKTLVKEGPLRVVLLGLRAGSTLREHDAEGPVSLHALSGNVEVESQGQVKSLEAGSALVFGASVAHSLRAQADSVVLVTIAWPQAR